MTRSKKRRTWIDALLGLGRDAVSQCRKVQSGSAHRRRGLRLEQLESRRVLAAEIGAGTGPDLSGAVALTFEPLMSGRDLQVARVSGVSSQEK